MYNEFESKDIAKKERAMLAFCGGFKIKLPDESCGAILIPPSDYQKVIISDTPFDRNVGNYRQNPTYVNALKKFWRKKLKHIKMPMKRKRDIVKQYTFATISKHMSDGLPAKK